MKDSAINHAPTSRLNMGRLFKITLMVSCLLGFSYFAQAEIHADDTLDTDPYAMLGVEEVLSVVSNANLKQIDMNAQRLFEEFFNQKGFIPEPAHQQGAEAGRSSAPSTLDSAGPKAPPRRSIKAF